MTQVNLEPGIRLAALSLLVLGAVTEPSPAADAYLADQIWNGKGELIRHGALVVDEGQIREVGPREVVDTTGCTVHDLGPAVLIPGLVVAETSLATGSSDGQYTIAPELMAVDGFDFFGDFDRYLAGGVTTAQIVPGGNRLVPGQGGVVKLGGPDVARRTLAIQESLRVVLGFASRIPPKIFEPPVGAVSVDRPLEPTQPQLGGSLASALSGLRALFRAARADGAGAEVPAETAEMLAAVRHFAEEKRTVRVTAVTPAEIRASVGLAKEFGLQLLLVNSEGLDPFLSHSERWSELVKGFVLNVGIRPGQVTSPAIPAQDAPKFSKPWDHARKLIDQGYPVAIRSVTDGDLEEILFLAGLFQQGDLSPQEVLQMLTRWPAELLGVADRVGTLEPGKDADFVVLSEAPFRTRTTVHATYIAGRRVFDRAAAGQTTVIQVSEVYDGEGGVHQDSSVVVRGGKVVGLGSDVSAPLNADLKRFPGAVIVPGYVDLSTGLGLGGSLTGSISLSTKLGEQLFAEDPAIEIARQGGVTSALLYSRSSSSPTPVIAFKLGKKLTLLREPAAIRFAIGGNLTSSLQTVKKSLTQGKTYADNWNKYDAARAEYEKKLKEYEAAKAKYDEAKKKAEAEKAKKEESSKKEAEKKQEEKKQEGGDKNAAAAEKEDDKQDDGKADAESSKKEQEENEPELKAPEKPKEPKKPSTSSSLEPYRALFALKIPALVDVHKTTEIEAALKLFREEFKLKTVLLGAEDTSRLPVSVPGKDVAVAIGPTLVREVERETVNLAQELANRQVPFGFQSQATTGAQTLPLAVTFAVRKGLGVDDALRGLTSHPAKMMLLQDRIGKLAVGRDADLVVLSGPPFALGSQVLAVMIDGEWVFEKESR